MVNRTRDRFIPIGPGYSARKITTNPVVENFPPQDVFPDTYWWSRCVDVSGLPLQDHPLTITERDDRGWPVLNGHIDQGGGSYIEYKNYSPSAHGVNVSHVTASPALPSVGTSATLLRARTNPSREYVSLPNFAAEIKDFPQMFKQMKSLGPILRNLRHRNKAALGAVASQYLGYEFGWKPLISDLSQMLQFQVQVDKRIVELNRLYSSTGLKRRLTLLDQTNTDEQTGRVIDSSLGTFITANKFIVTRRRRWGTIRWRPTVVPADIGHQALGREARRLVYGMGHLGLDATQAWNVLPFSWLADWFGNFGTWLAAHRNDVPAAPTGPCNIMTLTETYESWFRTDSAKLITGGEGVRILRTKERAQSSGTLSVTLPLATARQFSILAALNLQRRKR